LNTLGGGKTFYSCSGFIGFSGGVFAEGQLLVLFSVSVKITLKSFEFFFISSRIYFYIFLSVHLCVILVGDQLDALCGFGSLGVVCCL